MNTTQIREHMPVVCSNSKQFGTVDKVEGDHIKLTKDQSGQHHWIPASWVKSVDDKVHVDRPGQQAMKEWMSTPPEGAMH
ncbi:MAG: DUF2171 domain-containing protein [Vicinamibacterales bacterium]